MMLVLRCPKCKNSMNYRNKDAILTAKRKACVYCGRSFKIKDNIIKRLT